MGDDSIGMLREHVRRFNEAVRSGDFSEMIGGFAPGAEMVFEGVPVGPFVGREAIADAYRDQPPDDQVRLLGAPTLAGEAAVCDYAWARENRRAGQMMLTPSGGLIARLVVTFE